MITIPFFTVDLADDGRWRIRFRKDLDRAIGRGSSYLSFENKETAERIAGFVARDAKRNRQLIVSECPAAFADEKLPRFGWQHNHMT